ncbi:MAG: ribosome silencing factor [Treponema sp.]|jgi:ribosome-associated protein|nr:ribosome silencing factor [Treponema sp.]
MNDMLQETDENAALALDFGRLLAEHSGGDVVVMDMRELNFWTDFFVIATVTSGAHLSGLERHVKDLAGEKGLPMRRSRKIGPEDEWCLLDLGNVVIHLMSPQSRSFYELERLWSTARQIKQANPEAPA